ncbi:lipoate--protein ligase family protein [Cohnella hongkongensis]|uniref:Biotin/lipoate A/B protein ligase family protein n=1 Tax=Cohnella hongkongensis TaxID=178337 RepID=A0ABV9FFF0_9BACL
MDGRENEWARGIRILDRTAELDGGQDVARSFAIDELLGRGVGGGADPVCHLWRHPRAFVIGARDSRLPGAPEAARRLRRMGYSVLVRHSGGAAVPLDAGVANVSLVLPIDVSRTQNYSDDFEKMARTIGRALSFYGVRIDKGEIAGSYCPGDYDLSVDGLKFCGIAQRRQLKAMIVQAFVVVEGSGAERAELVKAFYDEAAAGAGPEDYPAVRPDTMTSLNERAPAGPASAEAFTGAVVRALEELARPASPLRRFPLHRLDEEAVAGMSRKLRERYPLLS